MRLHGRSGNLQKIQLADVANMGHKAIKISVRIVSLEFGNTTCTYEIPYHNSCDGFARLLAPAALGR